MYQLMSEQLTRTIRLLWKQSDASKFSQGFKYLENELTNEDIDIEAYYFLGRCYCYGEAGIESSEENYDKSIEIFIKGAEHGSSRCVLEIYILNFLDDEQKTKYSFKRAFDKVMEMAENGDAFACYQIGMIYYLGDIEQYYPQKLKNKEIENINEEIANEAIKWFKIAANLGLIIAMRDTAFCYVTDKEGYTYDEDKYEYWLKRAVDIGDSSCEYYLASYYVQKEKFDLAFELYHIAANKGFYMAQNSLGDLYYNGIGVQRDYNKAFDLYKKASECGYSNAQNNLGECYYYGIGTSKDNKEAFKWFSKAAEQKNVNAMFNLGYLLYNGQGCDVDYDKAKEFYELSAEGGNKYAQTELADCYYHGKGTNKDYSKAFYWYKKASEQDEQSALSKLADCYYNGNGCEVNYKKAFEIFEKLAQIDDSNSQNMLGTCYEYGKGIAVDKAKAFYWYNEASQKNNIDAVINLANCYYNGVGCEINYEKAIELFDIGIRSNNNIAYYRMGEIYEKGKGIAKSYSKASELYSKASELGNTMADEKLKSFKLKVFSKLFK